METLRTVRIVNPHGLHARPCHAFVSACLPFQSAVRVRCRDRSANGRSILEMMTLAGAIDEELEIAVDGPDAEQLADVLVALVERGFGERVGP